MKSAAIILLLFSALTASAQNVYSGKFSGTFNGDGSGVSNVAYSSNAQYAVTATTATNAPSGAGLADTNEVNSTVQEATNSAVNTATNLAGINASNVVQEATNAYDGTAGFISQSTVNNAITNGYTNNGVIYGVNASGIFHTNTTTGTIGGWDTNQNLIASGAYYPPTGHTLSGVLSNPLFTNGWLWSGWMSNTFMAVYMTNNIVYLTNLWPSHP